MAVKQLAELTKCILMMEVKYIQKFLNIYTDVNVELINTKKKNKNSVYCNKSKKEDTHTNKLIMFSLEAVKKSSHLIYQHFAATPQISWPLLNERLGRPHSSSEFFVPVSSIFSRDDFHLILHFSS